MPEQYDMIVVGGGPAGLSAAINMKARAKSVLVIGNQDHSIKLAKAPIVDNYLGMPGLSGQEMAEKFLLHAKEAGAQMIGARVNQIYVLPQGFQVLTDQNEIFMGKTLLLATGTVTVATLEKEMYLLGRGVSYCATCDGMLYRGKEVLVLGYSQAGENEANFLADICHKVYYLPLYKEVGSLKEKIKRLAGKPTRLIGQDKVEGIVLGEQVIDVDAVFIAREAVPLEQLLPGLKCEDKFIAVDRTMATNLPGVFAAGDCVGRPHQIGKAVGEGLVAALSAAKYVENLQRSEKDE